MGMAQSNPINLSPILLAEWNCLAKISARKIKIYGDRGSSW